jgi:hypothetical protein
MPDVPAFRHFYIYVNGHEALTWNAATCSLDMDMQYGHEHGHGHAARIWLCSMDLDSAHAWMHGCRNADEKLSPA